MKCAFNECDEEKHLPLTLNNSASGKTFHFCNMAHLFGWLLVGMGQSMEHVMHKAIFAAKNPAGRKALASYIVDKFL